MISSKDLQLIIERKITMTEYKKKTIEVKEVTKGIEICC